MISSQIRDWKQFTIEWIFLGLSLFAFLGTLGITIERLVSFASVICNESDSSNNCSEGNLAECTEWTCNPDVTFTVVLIINISECT